MARVQVQNIDGEAVINLPEGVTAKDLEDWLNNQSNKKKLDFEKLPERWTSAEQGD